MGYEITLVNSDCRIPKEHWDDAFAACVELNDHDERKTGGDGTNVWFAWMPPDYPERALAEYESYKLPHPLVWVFQVLGFDWDIEENGDFSLRHFDSKSGAEDDFLEAVAPFVRPDGILDWRGEDGEMWRQEFDGQSVSTKQGRMVYD